ncbi:MAG: TIGR03560 family F420-dependent LLM class oxidoreductase [Ilumatobacter sp.]|nr:TIGR03560 family F420-dependent LLM class oxidoreductase [Ilumatobacter sp.]
MVLAGPSGSGKSVWSAANFRPDQIVSSDSLRALVGLGEDDQRAGTDAFAVLADVVERRMKRGVTTVVDSLGLDAEQRSRWIESARRFGRPVHAVAFDTAPAVCRRRNKARARPVPSKALSSQLARWPDGRAELADEVDELHTVDLTEDAPPPSPPPDHREPAVAMPEESGARLVPPRLHAQARGDHARSSTSRLRFGLTVSSFTWPGETAAIGPTLAAIARDAEEAGFSSLWVMDHVVQIPQVGREWEPMLESTSALGYLAAATERIRLGTLVTGITYRNIAHVGKIAATLDVLSGGRAVCGLGAAWFEREHRVYGWDFPPLAERYELLEDALVLLPLLWGPGSPSFSGRRIEIPEAICYPRPIQERIPILVGGSGERRTLRLVARHADACNLFGEPDVIRRKVAVLHEHCEAENRDPSDITVTQLSSILCASAADDLDRRLTERANGRLPVEILASELNAGTVDDHIGRFAALADAGVDEVIVALADVGDPDAVERFAPVIAAFAG